MRSQECRIQSAKRRRDRKSLSLQNNVEVEVTRLKYLLCPGAKSRGAEIKIRFLSHPGRNALFMAKAKPGLVSNRVMRLFAMPLSVEGHNWHFKLSANAPMLPHSQTKLCAAFAPQSAASNSTRGKTPFLS